MTGVAKPTKRPKLKGAGQTGRSKAKRSLQGTDLPADGSVLGTYPVGCCVLIAVSSAYPVGCCALVAAANEAPAWHMVLFRIGKVGNPHCGRLSGPPDREGWNARMGDARETREDVVVLASCWPFRAALDEGSELDPLALQSNRTAAGSVSVNHLRGIS